MIIKAIDPNNKVAELERLMSVSTGKTRTKIEQELKSVRSGVRGEEESAYLIDFDLKDSKNTAVIHDLRLEINGRVAQIDHLLIHRTLNVFVLETKNFHAGFKITEDGEFLRWNGFKKNYEGMPSPISQNERHISVLKDAFSQIEMPKRMGMKLTPVFHSYILVASSARVDRPKKFDTSQIVKADMWSKTLDKNLQSEGVVGTFGNLARFVGPETLKDIASRIVALHVPASFDYASKFGVTELPKTQDHSPESSPKKEAPGSNTEDLKCRWCGSHDDLNIQYGKYGYYFKCNGCDGNTPIKIDCGQEGHKERIRKEKNKFFRECADCKTSTLFFVNRG